MPLVGNIHPFFEFGPKAAAIICILFLTGINYIGVIFGGIVQTIVRIIKIAAIIALAVVLITLGNGSFANVITGFSIAHNNSSELISAIGLALAGAFWAYDGWTRNFHFRRNENCRKTFLLVCFTEH